MVTPETRIPRMICLILLIAGLSKVSPASAQAATGPTALATVVNSAYLHYPGIRAARSNIDRSNAEILSARGAFDPRVEGRISNRLGGYYDGDTRLAGFHQSFPAMGAEIFAEFSHSDGRFPVYEQRLLTADHGKARLGFALSLLRDRRIDSERMKLDYEEIERQIAQNELTAERVSVVQQAYVAYARWVTSARLLEAYRALLTIAEDRDTALQRQVEAGNAAEILLVESRQSILQRRGLVVEAERQLAVSAQSLSLFLRDGNGATQLPVYAPSLTLPESSASEETAHLDEHLDRILQASPEIHILQLMQEQVQLERSLARNDMQPRLDFKAYTSRHFGAGPENLLDAEQVVDFSFSIPLQNRQARGRVSAADARLDGLRYELRLLQEQTGTDLRNALTSLNASRQQLETARQEAEAATALVEAETRRFETGQSDFFFLNVRETALAQAQLRLWGAERDYQIALAGFHGLSLDLRALGVLPGHLQSGNQ